MDDNDLVQDLRTSFDEQSFKDVLHYEFHPPALFHFETHD